MKSLHMQPNTFTKSLFANIGFKHGQDPAPFFIRDRVKHVSDFIEVFHRLANLPGIFCGVCLHNTVSRALASRPEIIFADEPTGNLDSTTGAEILEFMRQAVREMGQTIVMVTHDPVAASYADRVVFLADGTIVDEVFDPTPDSVLDRMKALG